jgi:hypothetical protein
MVFRHLRNRLGGGFVDPNFRIRFGKGLVGPSFRLVSKALLGCRDATRGQESHQSSITEGRGTGVRSCTLSLQLNGSA